MEMEARGLPEATRRHLGTKIRAYKDSLDGVAADLKRAKEKFSRAALMSGASGGAGASGRPLDFDASLDSRNRMSAATDKMRTGTSMLSDAHRTIEETITVGEGTMAELHRNREQMVRIRSNVGVVSGTLDEARRILRSESSRPRRPGGTQPTPPPPPPCCCRPQSRTARRGVADAAAAAVSWASAVTAFALPFPAFSLAAGMARREVRTKIMLGVFAVVLVSIIIGLIVWIVKSKNEQSTPAPAPAPSPSATPHPAPSHRALLL